MANLHHEYSSSEEMARVTFFFFLIFLSISAGECRHSRVLRDNSSSLVSDGMESLHLSTPYLQLDHLTSSMTCESTYGFLPCSSGFWGQLFLIVVYEYLLFVGEKYVSAGSELLFKVLGPGYFGASAFQVLGSLPEAVLIIVSGISENKEIAREQVIMGMGLLAGSTVLLLTLVWGSIIVAGSYNISESKTSLELKDTKRSRLTGFGVIADIETGYTARIMVLSMIPFIIVQLPKVFNSSSGESVAIIISCIVSIAFLFIYCLYQVFQPWIQNRRLEYLLHKYVQKHLLGVLLNDNGTPNTTAIRELFHKIDQNNDTFVSPAEVRALILGIQFEEIGLKNEDVVVKVMEEFGIPSDARIDEAEFIRQVSKWLVAKYSVSLRKSRKKLSQKFGEENDFLIDQRDNAVVDADNPVKTYFKAASFLLLGITILAILAEPLIDTVQSFSTAANIPSFFASFIITPLAVNYRQAMAAITSAKMKKQRSASLTFSEIYSAVFMNNIVGLGVFLALVYVQGLTWDFSAEVLVVLVICTIMGISTSFCTTFPLWTCLLAYALYPFSLLLVYILTYTSGWS